MAQVRLYCVNSLGSHPALRAEVGALSSAFARLSAPEIITHARLSRNLTRYSSWQVRTGENGPAMSVGEWLEQLTIPSLAEDFRHRLSSISRQPLLQGHKTALAPFNIGRFCEFRAALAALRVKGVASVKIVLPNSEPDRRKVDLLVLADRHECPTPIQVKASGAVAATRGRIPVLSGVWRRDFDGLREDISAILKGRKDSVKHRGS